MSTERSKKTHIMVDLETLSTRTNAAILAIGAVKFNEYDGVYAQFYQAVQTPPNKRGFDISSDTLDWWSKQSAEAQMVFKDPNATSIDLALLSFTDWALEGTEKSDIILWGNGSDFDNAILSTAYALCSLPQPWEFWNNSCYRTIKRQNPDVELVRTGTYHNALNDAETQTEHLLHMDVKLD